MDYTKEDIYSVDLSKVTSSITVSNTGSANVVSGTNITVPWTTTTTTSDRYTFDPNWANSTSTKIQLNGPDADIEINGKSLTDMICNIEQRLNILRPNPKLESEWEELRKLGDQYRELESQIIEKQKMWDTLKK